MLNVASQYDDFIDDNNPSGNVVIIYFMQIKSSDDFDKTKLIQFLNCIQNNNSFLSDLRKNKLNKNNIFESRNFY